MKAMSTWLRWLTDAMANVLQVQPAHAANQAARDLEWGKTLMNKTEIAQQWINHACNTLNDTLQALQVVFLGEQ